MARASEGTQGAGDMRIASVSDEAGSSNPESSAALGQRVDASIWQQHVDNVSGSVWTRRSGNSMPGPGILPGGEGGWDKYGSAFPISDWTWVSGRLRAGQPHSSRGEAS